MKSLGKWQWVKDQGLIPKLLNITTWKDKKEPAKIMKGQGQQDEKKVGHMGFLKAKWKAEISVGGGWVASDEWRGADRQVSI